MTEIRLTLKEKKMSIKGVENMRVVFMEKGNMKKGRMREAVTVNLTFISRAKKNSGSIHFLQHV